MAFKSDDDLGDGEFLREFWTAILTFLRGKGFRNCAEDVASDMVVGQLDRMQRGNSFRPHGKILPQVLKLEACRKAKKASSLRPIGESELDEIRSPDGMEDEGLLYRELMPILENAFGASQVDGMIGAVAAGRNGLRDLAVAAGISERTLRTRLRGMGVVPRR